MTGVTAMAPQEVAIQVERLSQDLARLRQQVAVERRVFSHWAISVGIGHLVFSLALWLGIAKADKTNVEFLWIFVMSAIVTSFVGLSVLVSLASTRGVRRFWLGAGKFAFSSDAEPSRSRPFGTPIPLAPKVEASAGSA
jgi:hypothetical protein